MKRTDENHSFNIHVANVLKGHVQKAILLKEIYGWVQINASKKINIRHGIVWTYMSSSGFGKKFPYMGEPSIRRWITSLEKEGWLRSGRFNKKAYDKTKWYTININKYDDAVLSKIHTIDQDNQWTDQIDQWIAQNDQSFDQIDQWIAQSDQPIPSPTQLLKKTIIDNSEELQKIKDLEKKLADSQKTIAELQEKPKKEKTKRFVPPTLLEVQEYCTEQNMKQEFAGEFIDYNINREWKTNAGTKMKDWKAAFRTSMRKDWNAKYKNLNGTAQKPKSKTLDPSTLKTYQLELLFGSFKIKYSHKREKELVRDFKHTIYETGQIIRKELIEIERPAVENEDYLGLIYDIQKNYPELYKKAEITYNQQYNRA